MPFEQVSKGIPQNVALIPQPIPVVQNDLIPQHIPEDVKLLIKNILEADSFDALDQDLQDLIRDNIQSSYIMQRVKMATDDKKPNTPITPRLDQE